MMKDELFSKYVKLYESGIPIKDINPIVQDPYKETYEILLNSNVDVRIIDRDEHLAEVCELTSIKHFSKDTEQFSNRFFYAIPVQTVKGTIVGFIFRTVFSKNYVTVNRSFADKENKVPFMFGFYKDFEKFDKYHQCPPVVVCEGLKDCITLKKIYPFVLANNTSSMGINLQILSNITDKFVIIYDNDKAGEEGTEKDKASLSKLKYIAVTVKPSNKYKDCAECYYKNKKDFKEFADNLKETIKDLMSGNALRASREIIQR